MQQRTVTVNCWHNRLREVGSKNLTLQISILSSKKNTDEVCLSACDYVVVVVRTGYDSTLTGKSQFLLREKQLVDIQTAGKM